MLFNSMTFAVFLTAVFILYHIVPARLRWIFLLAASYVFYMNLHVAYGLLLLFTTALTYFLALGLEKTPTSPVKNAVFSAASCLLWVFSLYSSWARP